MTKLITSYRRFMEKREHAATDNTYMYRLARGISYLAELMALFFLRVELLRKYQHRSHGSGANFLVLDQPADH